jgi:hypothetical protein
VRISISFGAAEAAMSRDNVSDEIELWEKDMRRPSENQDAILGHVACGEIAIPVAPSKPLSAGPVNAANSDDGLVSATVPALPAERTST